MSETTRRKMRTWGPVLAAALCLVVGAGVALAAKVEEAYVLVSADGTANSATILTSTRTTTGGDTTTASRRKYTQGDPTIVVAPRCTASGGTACVEVRLFHRNNAGTETAITASVATCTFTSTELGDGLFVPSEPLTFPTYGLQRYEVLYRNVSSGTAHDYNWTLGAASRSGQ